MLYISPCPVRDTEYKASFPTNPYQKVRLGLARFLIKTGYKLLLNNGTVKITTGSSDINYAYKKRV